MKALNSATPNATIATNAPSVNPTMGQSNAALLEEIRARRGVRAHQYGGLFDDSNTAERLFRAVLPRAVAWVNKGIARHGNRGLSVTSLEVATTFITEGGYFALDDGRIANLDGFRDLGLDTIGEASGPLLELLGEDLGAQVRANAVQRENEQHETVTSTTGLTLEQGVLAVAAQYGWCKVQCAYDMKTQGLDMAKLPRADQMYWSTIYFNAGAGTGKKILEQRGVGLASRPWKDADPKRDDALDPTHNAAWRTASFELLEASVGSTFTERDPRSVTSPEAEIASARDEVMPRALAYADELLETYDEDLHGRRVADEATWRSVFNGLLNARRWSPTSPRAVLWSDGLRRALRYFDFVESLQSWVDEVAGADIVLAYREASRDISGCEVVGDPVMLRSEADALENDYGWFDRLPAGKVDVAKVARMMRAFADGE